VRIVIYQATSNLRKEQEEEARIAEKTREQRAALEAVEARCSEASRRLTETRNSGSLSQSPEELLSRLSADVISLNDRKQSLDSTLLERSAHLEKLAGWDTTDRTTTEDDVKKKRTQLRETERTLQNLQVQLDDALERNPKLSVFKQASTLALSKLREREEALEKIDEEKRRLSKLTEEKDEEIQRIRGAKNPLLGKMDLKKYGAQVREKIEKYKKMRDELSSIRAELVVLQRTEQLLKGKLKNLDEFLTQLEKKKGVQVSRFFPFLFHLNFIY
jgi:intraflagellar transport protein 81